MLLSANGIDPPQFDRQFDGDESGTGRGSRKRFRSAGIWVYPCRYLELCPLPAMKAQAGGAIPVVIPNGGLQEYGHFGFRTHRGYYQDSEVSIAVGEAVNEKATVVHQLT